MKVPQLLTQPAKHFSSSVDVFVFRFTHLASHPLFSSLETLLPVPVLLASVGEKVLGLLLFDRDVGARQALRNRRAHRITDSDGRVGVRGPERMRFISGRWGLCGVGERQH